jgi:hypothetical protein
MLSRLKAGTEALLYSLRTAAVPATALWIALKGQATMPQKTVEITCIFCHRAFLLTLREEEQPMKCPYCKAQQEPHPPTPAVVPSPAQQLRRLTRYSDVSLPREARVGAGMSLLVRIALEPLSADALKLELEQQDKMEVTVIARPNGLELKSIFRRSP